MTMDLGELRDAFEKYAGTPSFGKERIKKVI
jgi:hypothetical protein